MPALTMRGRYMMREWWTDSDLFLKLDASQREILFGLYMLSDDEGWLPRDIPAIAKALGGYEDRAPREGRIRSVLDRLGDIGKVESLRCCLFVPAVSKYPRAGKKSREHLTEHQRHSNRPIPIQRDLNPSPVPSLPVPSIPDVAREPGEGPGSSLKDRLRVYGFDPGRLGEPREPRGPA